MNLQVKFDEYAKARREREAEESRQNLFVKPFRDALKAVSETAKEIVRPLEEEESQAKLRLEETARAAKENGSFGDRARLGLLGGYVEVQRQKQKVAVSDLQTFLNTPGWNLLVVGVVLNEEAILAMQNPPPGIIITEVPGAFKVSVEKENENVI